MGVADLIISGALKKKKKEENTYNVKDGTYTAEAVKSTNKKVKDTVDTFNNVSDRIKSNTTMSFDDDNKTYKTKSTITDEEGNVTYKKPKKEEKKNIETDSKGNVSILNTKAKPETNKNIVDNAAMITKSVGLGGLGGLTGIVDSPFQSMQEGAEKAKTKSKQQNIIESLLKYEGGIASDLVNIPDFIKNTTNTLQDKDKNAFNKTVNIGMDLLNNLSTSQKLLEGAGQISQTRDKNHYKDILNARRLINDPYENANRKFNRELENYGKFTQTASELGQIVGNMLPSMAATAVTKNPNIGKITMGYGAKGQATREAENKGADISTANDIGFAKGLTEVGTESLSGGLNFFGKGALDDVLENGVNKLISNPLGNFAAKKGLGVLGEIIEEEISDTIGFGIDKSTTDPDAEWSWSDRGKTALMTLLSTGILNTISGGYSRKAYQLNEQELKNISENPKVKQKIDNTVNQVVTTNMTPQEVKQVRQEVTATVLGEIQDNVDNVISNAIQEVEKPNQTLLYNINQGVSEQNVQTPYEEEIEQITPLNEINQELQEVRQNDIEDSVQALNLEEDVDEDINTVETLEEETIANSFETYLKENNIENLTKEDIQNFIQKAIEEQGNISEEQKVELQNKYFDSIMNYIDEKIKPVETPETPIQETEQQIKPETLNEETPNTYIKNVDNRITPESIKQENKTESKQNNIGEQFINQFKANENKAMESLDKTSKMFNLDKTKEFTQKEGNYVYVSHENPKIDAFRRSAATYMTNSPKTQNFVRTLEKIIKDKNIEIRLDPNLKDEKGRIANASQQGAVITLNPNSTRAGEFLAIHELTHAIGTKSMIKMIENYRKSNAEFDSAVKKLLTTYKTEEINEEALADISGQLFGNQEFINNLSMENPSLFKKIYNEIKYLWHQFTGYKNQDQFIEDLRNKWESAYRNQKVQQKAKNSNIEMSNQVDSNGNQLSNEQVDYFKDSKVRDENGNLIPVYHGTASGEFTVFDKTKGNVEGDFGRGLYFTNNENDVNRNYEDGGPDFENKVSRLAERIEQDEDISYEEAKEKAREQLYKGGHRFNTYLNIENPAIVGETRIFDADDYNQDIENDLKEEAKYYQDEINEYAEEYELTEEEARDEYLREQGIYDDIVNRYLEDDIEKAVASVENELEMYDSSELRNLLWESVYDGGLEVQELKDKINERLEIYNNVGDLANNEATRLILESLGYDGIIDNTVSNKFNNMDMDSDTTHYIAFYPNQIKNIDNLTPTKNDDIRYSINEELDNSSFIIEKNEDVNKLELPKSPYQTLRPNVRGGWNIDKIQKQLKNESSNRVNSKDLSKFDNLDDLMNNVYYHGSISAHDNLKAGSTLQENQRTGGYGAEYHSISLSGNKNIASNFASMSQNGTVMPVILKKNANVIEMPNIEDSIELEDILPELWNKGVDAVKIGDWDIETKGYGEQELVILNPRAIMTMPQGTTYFKNYHKPKFQNMTKEEILETLTKTKERALNDSKLKPGQAEEIESRYDKLIKYSKDNQTWREYLEKEFPNQGTRTNLKDINERNKPKQENKTTQEEKPQEMPKNEVKQEVKKSYLTSAEQNELDGLRDLDNRGLLEENDSDYKRLQELEKKSQGITKKFPELKVKNTFDDIKGIYGKYKNNEISKENRDALRQAKSFIPANNQGRRTMEQWKQVAEFMGSNADIKSSEDLQKLAIETWFETRPNAKEQLNRQGKKYVPFAVQDWVNAVYKGAGVGTDVKMSIEENNTKSQKEVKKPKNSVEDSVKAMNLQNKQLKQEIKDTNKALNLEKENIKYSAEEKIEKSVRNQYKGLSEDKIQQIIELKEEQKEKDKMYSNFSNKQRAKQRIMINAYETNAKIRKIVQGDSLEKVKGGLTDTELAKAIEKENSNYIGKKVIVDGQNGTVIGNPYGRVKVEFEDGTIKTVDKSDVKSINESKKDEVLTLKDTNGKKVDLKPSGNNTYEQVNVKPKKNDVIPDMSNKVLNIGNEKVSNFYSNITEKSKFITEENRIKLMGDEDLKYYDAITNKDTLQNAMNKLDKNTEQQVGDFFAKKDFNAEDVATGWILVKRYQDAGNFEAMSNVIEKMREQGTKAGQAVQAYGILQRLTPEGMEYYSQKQLDKAFNEYSKNKSKKQIEKYAKDFTLTAKEHQFIKDTMKKVEKMKDEEAKKVEIAKIVSMLSDKMPPERGQRLKAWMRISMLGNPKTQVRNVAGNAIIQPVNWVGDIFAATADKIMAKQTGKRTIGTTDFGALARGTKQGLKDAIRDAKTGVDTRDINLDRFEENIGSKPFYEGHNSKLLNTAAKALNKTNKILGNIMSGGDRIFYQGIYENSLANQMKLNNVTKPTQEMKNIAEQEALSRTWNDSNEYTKAVLQIRNAMNKLNVKGYGLGDVLVPFAKTPANLTKAIVDYSPVGLTRSILQDGKNYKNSLENGQYSPELQHKFAESLGKGMAGSLLYVAAAALAKAGITSGASDDDKDVANFMRNTLGIQPYSVKIGDKSFTYDWAQPIAAPFAIMADAKRISEKENQELGDIITTATSSASNILLEQSFLSSIQDVFNSYEGPSAAIKQQIQDLPARATPTFFKQIADLIDPTSRQPFVKGNEKETLKNKVQVKIPGASKELVSQRDTLGREIQKYGGDEDKLKYAFNVFLNPANTNKGKKSEAAEEIYSIYKATGDKTIMPRQVGYSENIGGSIRNLTAKERNELQKLSGQKIEENVKALTQSSKYNSMSNEDKAAVINGIVNYSFAKAKSDLFDTNISTMYKTAAKKEEQGIPLYDYYINRVSKRR